MKEKIVIISPTIKDKEPWIKALQEHKPDLEVEIYPLDTKREETEFLLVWNPPEGVFQKYPNLKVISSIAAGVTHILKDPKLPKNTAIIKMNDPQQKYNLAVFVLSLVLNRIRKLDVYARQQAQSLWARHSYQLPKDTTVGIMGIGNIGQEIGKLLIHNKFKVSGWSRSEKHLKGIQAFHGDHQKEAFLKTAQILVCILPLTNQTKGILNAATFKKLPQKAYLINVGRGSHLVEKDLLDALECGQLSGASLDTFKKEPLPKNHPFWRHDKILITPHTASSVDPKLVSPKIIRNYDHMKNNEDLEDQIDMSRGY